MTKGILYIATGEQYLREAIVSAKSAKEQMPTTTRAIVTDESPDVDVFDEIIRVDNPDHSFRDNVEYITRTPFEKTIFLDSDTYICRDISGLFDLLDRFDFAATHDTGRRKHIYADDGTEIRAPDSFPMYNSGVIAFQNSKATRELFETWRAVYDRHEATNESTTNQPALREALYNTDIAIGTLPPEYNCRLPHPQYLRGKVKLIHGRANDFQSIEKILNADPTHRRRTFFSLDNDGSQRVVRLEVDKWMQRYRRMRKKLSEKGYISTFIDIVRWMRRKNQ